jgi:DhnA family fructose-bisphosphate aldolase class Ia
LEKTNVPSLDLADRSSVRLGRLFLPTGRAVVVACDHGEFDGPQPGLRDPLNLIRTLGDWPDGILMSPGTLARSRGCFSTRGGPLAIVRLNWNSVYAFGWSPTESVSADALDPEDALRMGADIALVSLTLHTGSEHTDAANVSVFSRVVSRCQRLGLPVIGEYFPNAEVVRDPDLLHEEVLRGSRILCELGAESVKTFFHSGWDDVAENCPVPILALGAERLPTDLDALQLAAGQVRSGARGVVFGRNVFQSADPVRFVRALVDVVKRDLAATVALDLAARPVSPTGTPTGV